MFKKKSPSRRSTKLPARRIAMISLEEPRDLARSRATAEPPILFETFPAAISRRNEYFERLPTVWNSFSVKFTIPSDVGDSRIFWMAVRLLFQRSTYFPCFLPLTSESFPEVPPSRWGTWDSCESFAMDPHSDRSPLTNSLYGFSGFLSRLMIGTKVFMILSSK